MLRQSIAIKNTFCHFVEKHRFILCQIGLMILLFLIMPKVFAGTTNGDLSSVNQHIQQEAKGEIPTILAWISFALSAVFMVIKMNLALVLSAIGIFFFLEVWPKLIASHFSALI